MDRDGPLPDLGAPDAVVDVARQPSWVRRAVAALPDAHWVFVSTCSVYADHATPGQTPASGALLEPREDDADLTAEPEAYGPLKVACEQAVLDGAASACVVRPGLIVGPGDPSGRFAYWPARLDQVADGEPVLAPGTPSDLIQVLDVRDLASWIVDLAEQRADGVLDAVGPPQPLASLLDEVARGCAVAPRWRWVPGPDLEAAAVAPWTGPRSVPLWLPRPEYDGMAAHDPAPAAAAGLRPRPLAQTAADTLAWLRATPEAPVTGLSRAEEAAVLARFHDSRA